MSRWSREEWLNDLEDWRVESVNQWVLDEGFWAYVDSQANAASHSPYQECSHETDSFLGKRNTCWDWTHRRGSDPDMCMAANSQLGRCSVAAINGLPFCAFHFDKVWRVIYSFVVREREQNERSMLTFDYDRTLQDHAMDIAMVRDARRQLAAGSEQVYFYAAAEFVKIGRSIDVAKRIKTLAGTKADGVDVRAGSLLGTIPGGSYVEHELHLRFRPHRVAGEWFAHEPIADDIAALIAEHSSSQENVA